MNQNVPHPNLPRIENEPLDRNLKDILLPYLKKLWLERNRILISSGSVTLLTILYQLLFVKPYFESSITILPEYGSKSSIYGSLGGLAAMAGVSLGENASPPDIYENLLLSESIMEPAIRARYSTKKFKDSVDLIRYYEIEPDDELAFELRDTKMLHMMMKIMTEQVIMTDLDPKTKLLKLTIRMPESKLSADVANKLVENLDEYVRTKRKSNASMQRSYIERRAKEVKDSMTSAENELKKFQSGNVATLQSPGLMLEQSRLNRQIQIFQAVYMELVRQLEIAKIDEIRDAPIINIREWAREPVVKAGPSRARTVIVITFLAFFLAVAFSLSAESLKNLLTELVTVDIEKSKSSDSNL